MIYQSGIIYGTTSSGGPQGQGTVFSLDIATGVLTTLHALTGGSDGGSPASSLILNGGLLVGTSEAGGASGLGTVYTVDPITGAETVLHSFSGPDGERPAAAVTAIGNVLYGTAPYGGAYGGAKKYGVLFSLDMVTMQETTLHSFTKKDGAEPFAGVLNLSGSLFGTTRYLGQGGGVRTVYSFDLKKSKLSIVYHFSEGKDGGSPQGDLIKLGNTLYGTCGYYGSYDGVRYSPSDSPDA